MSSDGGQKRTRHRWCPTVLVVDGGYDERALRGCRLDKEDVMEAPRSQEGIERVSEIKFAILEVSGNISIIKKQD